MSAAGLKLLSRQWSTHFMGKINPRTLDTRGGRPVLTGYRIFLMIGLDYTI
jgi:hypothetical protein